MGVFIDDAIEDGVWACIKHCAESNHIDMYNVRRLSGGDSPILRNSLGKEKFIHSGDMCKYKIAPYITTDELIDTINKIIIENKANTIVLGDVEFYNNGFNSFILVKMWIGYA
jgi:hypothetical protein